MSFPSDSPFYRGHDAPEIAIEQIKVSRYPKIMTLCEEALIALDNEDWDSVRDFILDIRDEAKSA